MDQRRSSSQLVGPRQSIEQVHKTMQSIVSVVKNMKEVKSHLHTKGWVTLGETVSLEVTAKVLFATVANTKLLQEASTVVMSVAYLLTNKLEEGILQGTANKISLHIKDMPDSITSDLHVKLDQHVQAVNEAAQSQATLTDKLMLAQEKLDEATEKTIMTSKLSQPVSQPTRHPSPHQCHFHRFGYTIMKR